MRHLLGPGPTHLLTVALCAVVLFTSHDSLAQNAEPSAEEIVSRVLERGSLFLPIGSSTLTMIIRSSTRGSRERTIEVEGVEEEDGFTWLARVVAPNEVVGQAYLFRTGEEDDEIYLFLPSLHDEAMLLTGRQHKSTLLGSAFNYAHMTSSRMRRGRTRKLEDESIGGFDAYVVEVRLPTTHANEEYAARIWVRKDDFVPLRIVYRDRQERPLHTLTVEEIAEHAGRPYVRRASLESDRGGATLIVVESWDPDATIDASSLTPEALAPEELAEEAESDNAPSEQPGPDTSDDPTSAGDTSGDSTVGREGQAEQSDENEQDSGRSEGAPGDDSQEEDESPNNARPPDPADDERPIRDLTDPADAE